MEFTKLGLQTSVHVFMILFISQFFLGASAFMLFKTINLNQGHQCASTDILFDGSFNTMGRCLSECRSNSSCLQVFYKADENYCMGCLSTYIQLSSTFPVIQRHVKQIGVYIGCFYDGLGRILPETYIATGLLTNDICLYYCYKEGYLYAGTETQTECWCGNGVVPERLIPDSECSAQCQGDSNQYCGGSWRISIYMYTGGVELL